MGRSFWIALLIVLSCCALSGQTTPAQPADDPQTQFNRGTDYWYGNGVPQNYAEAVNWFRKAAEQGYAPAQYRLGEMLATGQGIRQDDAEAAVRGSLRITTRRWLGSRKRQIRDTPSRSSPWD